MDARSLRWGHAEGGRQRCGVCPRGCTLSPGQRGFCFVRRGTPEGVELTSYGRSTGFCVDPIEKKPLSHFFPGTAVLSFGTAGCNLGCKFCQNWSISTSREVESLSQAASPMAIADAAASLGCRSVAFTYNDPVVWAEYAIDTAKAVRARGMQSVAVTAAYIEPELRAPFFDAMDAVNVDLKAFDPDFYRRLCFADIRPVLDTLAWLSRRGRTWVEITTLVIPGHNDDDAQLRALSTWIFETFGPDLPLHFSAFHPDFRMRDTARTPLSTLQRARAIAHACGLRYVYSGNVHDPESETTRCPGCRAALIVRDRYRIESWALSEGRCPHCATQIAGRFEARPGDWGRRRLPVQI